MRSAIHGGAAAYVTSDANCGEATALSLKSRDLPPAAILRGRSQQRGLQLPLTFLFYATLLYQNDLTPIVFLAALR